MNRGVILLDVIRSISYDQTEILLSILRLHVPSGVIDCDPTYSKGQFYKDGLIKQPRLRFDLYPSGPGIEKADCRHLPIADSTLNCMILDPPFLATTGKSLSGRIGNIINRRFGVYPNEKALHQFYIDSLKEAYRVLKPHGILIFKCQDKVSGGTQYLSHVFIANEAVKLGFYPRDLLVLLAKSRLTAGWQARNQKSARKYHCYFFVFEKYGKKVRYTD